MILLQSILFSINLILLDKYNQLDGTEKRHKYNNALNNIIIFNLFGFILFNYIKVSYHLNLITILLQLILFMFINTFLFYLIHRFILHNNYIYKKIHYYHHEELNGELAGVFLNHPIDNLISIVFAFYLPVIFVIPNVYAYTIYYLYTLYSGTSAHGYKKMQNKYDHHYIHHKKNNCNYSIYYIDVLFGTCVILKSKKKLK